MARVHQLAILDAFVPLAFLLSLESPGRFLQSPSSVRPNPSAPPSAASSSPPAVSLSSRFGFGRCPASSIRARGWLSREVHQFPRRDMDSHLTLGGYAQGSWPCPWQRDSPSSTADSVVSSGLAQPRAGGPRGRVLVFAGTWADGSPKQMKKGLEGTLEQRNQRGATHRGDENSPEEKTTNRQPTT